MRVESYTIAQPKQLQSKPSFKANPFDILNNVVTKTKVFKNPTVAQLQAFSSYVKAKPFMMGITADEVAKLNKFNGKDFIINSFEFLCKKLGINKDIVPMLNFAPEHANISHCVAQYSPSINMIMVNEKFTNKLQKYQVFLALRHELQHYLQSMNILRHETYGPKSIELQSKNFINSIKKAYETVYKNMPDSEVVRAIGSPQDIALISQLKFFDKTGNKIAMDNLYNALETNYRINAITPFRDLVINKMGVIKNDSALTPKIKKDFEEFRDLGYYNQDGSINYEKYFISDIENEAINSQAAAGFEFSQQGCFMRYAAFDLENVKTNQMIIDEMNSAIAKKGN